MNIAIIFSSVQERILNTFNVNAQKREKVVLWLARFGFSSRDLLAKMLGVNLTGQVVFFNKLSGSGIIKEEYIHGSRKRVVTLTNDGISEARIYRPDHPVRLFRRFPLHTIIHSYSIQHFLTTQSNVREFFSETELARQAFARRPDLLIISESGIRIAVEVELTQKDVNRVYFNFGGHVQDWQNDRIDHVIYLFASGGVLARYQSLYQKNPWPAFVAADGNPRHMSRAGSVDPQLAHAHGLMIFHRFEPYAL